MAITSSQLTPWQRRLIPSLTDMLFASLVFSQLSRSLFADGDTGWHLWAGLDVLRHGPRAIPDALSFTRAGASWVNLEWLADAVFAAGYRWAGYLGVSVIVCLLFAVTFTWLYRILLRDTGHVPAAALTMLLAAFVGLLQLLARPLVFSFLLVLAAWELVRVAGREKLAMFALPLLTVAWANLHPTAFLAPAFAGFAWLTRGRDRRLLVATLLSIAALGATPWGYSWLAQIAPVGDNLKLLTRIDEWQTPRFSEPRFWFMLAYLLLAVLARRWGPRLTWSEALLGMGCLGGTLFAVRLGPIAAILWAPILARDLAGWASGQGGWIPGRMWRAGQEGLAPFEKVFRPGIWPVAIGLVALLGAPLLQKAFPEASAGFPSESFPTKALAEAHRLGLGPTVLNNYGWGGWISWETRGRDQVFIDGRAGFFAGEPLKDYINIMEMTEGWPATLERRHPSWMLLQKDWPLVHAAPLTGRWRIVYTDSLSAVLAPVAPRP